MGNDSPTWTGLIPARRASSTKGTSPCGVGERFPNVDRAYALRMLSRPASSALLLLALLWSAVPAHATEEVATEKATAPPYSEEEVTFASGDVRLAGTLTLPSGKTGRHPAVALLTGSGAQNRDEEIFGFRPFRVLADHLARNGIVVLRFDDRGVGGSSGSLAETTTETLAADALAAAGLLRGHARVDPRAVGLLGHSEGGLVATLAATRSPHSSDIAFLVLLATSGVRGDRLISSQIEALLKLSGSPQEQIATTLALQERVYRAVRTGEGWEELSKEIPEAQLAGARTPWFRHFIDLDPAATLRQVRRPVLAIFGELDIQVPAGPNRDAMVKALEEGGNRSVTVQTFPGANHLFQKAATGSPAEYPFLAKELVPGLLDVIAGWIREQRPPA